MSTPILFLDTETTGLALDDDVWEFGAIRRAPDGTETEHHLFIEHDPAKCAQLPDSFRADHYQRFPGADSTGCSGRGFGVVTRSYAAGYIEMLAEDRPHIVGAVPSFDTERLALLLDPHGCRWGAHYHLIDVENLAVGYLAGLARHGHSEVTCGPLCGQGGATLLTPPWDSDELSRAIGIEPAGEGVRHTAMGDVRWAMAIYDRVMGTPQPMSVPARSRVCAHADDGGGAHLLAPGEPCQRPDETARAVPRRSFPPQTRERSIGEEGDR